MAPRAHHDRPPAPDSPATRPLAARPAEDLDHLRPHPEPVALPGGTISYYPGAVNRTLSAPVLVTKLYVPSPRPGAVPRPHLIARLDAGLHRKLTLVSAPAGFGKTTLVGAWVAGCGRPTAWLSLDDGESDPARFLTYLVAALQTVVPQVGAGGLGALQSPQPPPTEVLLTALLNELAALPGEVVLVLDDYHLIDATPVDEALAFLLERLPPRLHLVLATREDPPLPLARLRARGQLTELRAADLRFTAAEAAEFLNSVMGLNLSPADIAALEERTEGWIAGLQLAALSMQGHQDVSGLIRAFAGDNRYIVDYLIDEVLQRQLCRSSLYAFEGGAARSGSSAASARGRVVRAAWRGSRCDPARFLALSRLPVASASRAACSCPVRLPSCSP